MAELLPEALEACRACPRLVAHRTRVATEKRAAHRHEPYWGKPVPGFGDPDARLLLLGLAPGAHGSNRTGRQFTGDASGDVLFPALHRAGLADRPVARDRHDGLTLHGLWITSAARCAPPGNRPTRQELGTCRAWLRFDLDHLPRLRAVVALGAIAHDAYLELLRARGARLVKAHHPFGHGAIHRLDDAASEAGGLPLLDLYHVSRQNTATGRLTPAMLDDGLARACALADLPRPAP